MHTKMYAATNVVEEIKHKTNRFVPHTGPTVEFLVCYRIQPGTKAMSFAGKLFFRLLPLQKTDILEFDLQNKLTRDTYEIQQRRAAGGAVQTKNCGTLSKHAQEHFWRTRLLRTGKTSRSVFAAQTPCLCHAHAPCALWFRTAGIFLYGDSMRLRSAAEIDEATGKRCTV